MNDQDKSILEEISKNLDSQHQQITILGITLGVVLGVVANSHSESAAKIHSNLKLISDNLGALITDKRAKELQELLIKAVAPKEEK